MEAVERALTPRTRAIVPVDVNGRGADYRALEPFCRKHGLVLVCDAAEALGLALCRQAARQLRRRRLLLVLGQQDAHHAARAAWW